MELDNFIPVDEPRLLRYIAAESRRCYGEPIDHIDHEDKGWIPVPGAFLGPIPLQAIMARTINDPFYN